MARFMSSLSAPAEHLAGGSSRRACPTYFSPYQGSNWLQEVSRLLVAHAAFDRFAIEVLLTPPGAARYNQSTKAVIAVQHRALRKKKVYDRHITAQASVSSGC